MRINSEIGSSGSKSEVENPVLTLEPSALCPVLNRYDPFQMPALIR